MFVMANYILMLHGTPWSNQSVLTACQFTQAAIESGHRVSAIFLYQDSVLNAIDTLDIPSDELNGQSHLIQLKNKHDIKLMLCVTAAEKRGLAQNNIHPDFIISGLAEFAELTTQADKVIQFK